MATVNGMGIFDKVGSFLKREAKDLGDAAEGVKDKLDEELTKREQELKMTPSEKIAALQQEAMASDARIDSIVDKAANRGVMADAVAEVGEISAEAQLPTITHIVLPDGRVKSGDPAAGVTPAPMEPPAPTVGPDGVPIVKDRCVGAPYQKEMRPVARNQSTVFWLDGRVTCRKARRAPADSPATARWPRPPSRRPR